LPGADIASAFAMRYKQNQNPSLLPLTAALDGAPLDLGALPADKKVTLTASWTPESAESYPVFDIVGEALVDHRESLRVSWFATGGAFDHDRTGRGEEEIETSTDNVWQTPAAGPAHLWVVLRDSRGGVDFAEYDVTVQ
jgi:hypothetical protein